jgi:uncharacterized protein YkwD
MALTLFSSVRCAPRLQRIRALLVGSCALGAAVALAGCGGGGTGGDGGSGGTGGAPEPKYEAFPLPAQMWSHGEPTALEQALLEEVQRARGNPAGELDLLLKVPGVKSAMQSFMTDEQKLIEDFKTYSPVPPLAFDAKLMASSRFHSEDMAKNGFQEHDGSAGEPFEQRIADAGYQWSNAAENIFAFAESVPYCHAAFMVDWGNDDPGHRKAILDLYGRMRDIGISIIEMPASPSVGPLVVTQDFGMPAGAPPNAQRYIVGVAYRDLNENGAYDPGEGAPGFTVVPEKGDFAAVTSKSGGFAVPMALAAGLVKVQIQDEQLVALDEKETTLEGENVKLDFSLPFKKK